jgi:hypothetical protein
MRSKTRFNFGSWLAGKNARIALAHLDFWFATAKVKLLSIRHEGQEFSRFISHIKSILRHRIRGYANRFRSEQKTPISSPNHVSIILRLANQLAACLMFILLPFRMSEVNTPIPLRSSRAVGTHGSELGAISCMRAWHAVKTYSTPPCADADLRRRRARPSMPTPAHAAHSQQGIKKAVVLASPKDFPVLAPAPFVCMHF